MSLKIGEVTLTDSGLPNVCQIKLINDFNTSQLHTQNGFLFKQLNYIYYIYHFIHNYIQNVVCIKSTLN